MGRCAWIVMAVGREGRAGGGRFLQDLSGKPVIVHLLDTLVEAAAQADEQSGPDRILVVTDHAGIAALAEERGFLAVTDEATEPGRSRAIRLAVLSTPADLALLFIPGDMPFLSTSTLHRLQRFSRKHSRAILQPLFEGVPGHPILYPASRRDALLSLSGDRTDRSIFPTDPGPLLYLEVTAPWEGLAVDRVADLRKARRRPFDRCVAVRGAGALGTGVLLRLHRSGFRVVALETAAPTCLRRTVSLAEAVRTGRARVEELEGVLAGDAGDTTPDSPERVELLEAMASILSAGAVPVVVDPEGRLLADMGPMAVVDATGRRPGLPSLSDLPERPLSIVLGAGPPEWTDVGVEIRPGHDLGRVRMAGDGQPAPLDLPVARPQPEGPEPEPAPVPAPTGGLWRPSPALAIGRMVRAGDPLGAMTESIAGDRPVLSPRTGILTGLLPDGFRVRAGSTVAEVDARDEAVRACRTVSGQALAVAGGVLEALLACRRETGPGAGEGGTAP